MRHTHSAQEPHHLGRLERVEQAHASGRGHGYSARLECMRVDRSVCRSPEQDRHLIAARALMQQPFDALSDPVGLSLPRLGPADDLFTHEHALHARLSLGQCDDAVSLAQSRTAPEMRTAR